MTPVFACGGECRVLAPASLSTHWVLTGTAPTADTTIINPGGGLASYHWAALSSTASRLLHTIAQNTVSARFYVYFAAAPTATTVFAKLPNANGYPCLKVDSSLSMRIRISTSAADVTVMTLALNTWYLIDWKADTSGGTATTTVTVNGGNSTTDTHAQTAVNMTGFMVGGDCDGIVGTSPSVYFDDIIVAALADYPIGAGVVQGYLVGATSGTHSQTAGDFKDEASANITNADGSGAKLNEVTPSIAQYVQHPAVGTAGGYVEYIYSVTTGAVPRAVEQVVMVVNVSGTAGNNEKSQLYDGTTAADAYSLTTVGTATGKWMTKCWATAPSGGAWTAALLALCRIRWGFSNDINPVPAIAWTMLEVETAKGATPNVKGVNQAMERASLY